jgi:hypothetical protein
MTWGAVGSTAVSVIGGALMGGSKEGERTAKDQAARAIKMQEDAKRQARADLSPYMDSGAAANKLLGQYLGTADPEGYAAKPTLQDFEDRVRDEHYRKFGQDYNRNSNIAEQRRTAKKLYDAALSKWETGKKDYINRNPESQGDGRLLRDFTNEDFVKDPGYEARLLEGEKGNFRSLAAGGNLASGKALKALERYRQDYASNEFGNAYNRDAANKGRIYSFLAGEKGMGIGAAGTAAGISQNAANASANIGQNATNQVIGMQQNREDNQSNLFQSAIGNLIYGMERNKPVVSNRTVYSSDSEKPWYYSG